MKKQTNLRDIALSALEQNFVLTPIGLGADSVLSKKGMTFNTESWNIERVGHLCFMKMKAFFGLMRMETLVIAPMHVDAPLFNLDWVNAFGAETQIAELYDVQLQPWSDEHRDVFERLLQRDADLPDAPNENEHWYDSILYPCSYHKKGKGLTERFSIAAQDYLVAYVDQLACAPTCDMQEKSENVRAFAERLFDEGGPAVDQVTKLFGQETARRLILEHMYGVRER